MPVSDSFRTFVLEQLGQVAPVRDRRMFGGVGLYAGEHFFALIADNTLYFKVDDTNRPAFESEGMQPFRPQGADGPVMGYYTVPAHVLEDVERLRIWVDAAVDAARRSKNRKQRKG